MRRSVLEAVIAAVFAAAVLWWLVDLVVTWAPIVGSPFD
jgi:hypothetical protein